MKMVQIVFSPTGGTQKAADLLTKTWGDCTQVDLTDSKADFSAQELTDEDVALIAVPSYGGRVPAPAFQRLTAIHGNGARAVLLCVYGNRDYEDTLVELEDGAKQAGFQVVAAVAAIAEHSIARRYAAGRPDSKDAEVLAEFAAKIQAKLDSNDDRQPQIPGHRPYKETGSSGMMPKATKSCVHCGVCAEKCPVQAIDLSDPTVTDKDKCISCMRCVAVCPHSARKIGAVMMTAVDVMLKKVCSDRKEAELYL